VLRWVEKTANGFEGVSVKNVRGKGPGIGGRGIRSSSKGAGACEDILKRGESSSPTEFTHISGCLGD
jgi:hypothetical protein